MSPFPRPMSFHRDELEAAQQESLERLRALFGPRLIDERAAYSITFRKALVDARKRLGERSSHREARE